MAKTNALTGSYTAKFKAIELHENLTMISDSRGPRTVVHEFPYRDGAKIEVLGRKPHKTVWTITFTGPDWLKQFRALSDDIDKDPSGTLIHPIYGQMQVVCQGFDGASVNIPEATDTITFPLTFMEDQLDLGVKEQQSVSTLKQDVDAAGENLTAAAAAWTQAALLVEAMVNAAGDYAAAAFESVANATINPSLSIQLAGVGVAMEAAQAAILADPAAIGTTFTYDAIAGSEVLYAACLILGDEVALDGVGYELFMVEGLTSIAILCGQRYGSRALEMVDPVLQLNPNLSDPSRIQAGTPVIFPL